MVSASTATYTPVSTVQDLFCIPKAEAAQSQNTIGRAGAAAAAKGGAGSEAIVSSDDVRALVRKPPASDMARHTKSAEQRVMALESLTLITTLLVAEAIREGLDTHRDEWTHPRLEIYCALLFFAMLANLYLSAVSLMVIVACKRVCSWDFNFEHMQDPGAIWRNDDYQFMMTFLYGEDKSKWLHPHDQGDGTHLLKLPLQYYLLKRYVDGPFSATGLGICGFPVALTCQIIAVAIDYTKVHGERMHMIVFATVIPFSVVICFFVTNLTRVVLH